MSNSMEMTSEEIMKSSTSSTCSPSCKCHNTSMTGWTIRQWLQTCLSCTVPLFKLVSQTATCILYITPSDSSLCISWSCNSKEKMNTAIKHTQTHQRSHVTVFAGTVVVVLIVFPLSHMCWLCLTLPPPQGRWYNGCCKSRSQFQDGKK